MIFSPFSNNMLIFLHRGKKSYMKEQLVKTKQFQQKGIALGRIHINFVMHFSTLYNYSYTEEKYRWKGYIK